jgi:hypothetical protein
MGHVVLLSSSAEFAAWGALKRVPPNLEEHTRVPVLLAALKFRCA